MKAFLMHRDRDFNLESELPANEAALTQDLELDTLFNAMALGDEFLFEVAKKAVLSSLNDLEGIRYRQEVLKDCLRNPEIVRAIYELAVDSIEGERKIFWGSFSKYPPAILSRAIEVLQLFVGMLKKLRNIVEEHAYEFKSEGFRALFAMFEKELDDEYFARVQDHLNALKFRRGVLVSAELGKGNRGTNYTLCKPLARKQSLVERIFASGPPAYTFYIADRDQAGAEALSELNNRGINLVANALARSTDHVLSFFKMLRTELAFYLGCLNLQAQLAPMGVPSSFPVPVASTERRHSFRGLYDISLALTMKERVVGNDLSADHMNLVIITGANQGGKSTFLRSIGLSQLMMQCGMFVPAESFSANVCDGLFTHYKREEDVSMTSGKLDEELARMSDIVDSLRPSSLLLFNESFAATNEREGSEIAGQIVSVLLEDGIKAFFVTHLFEFARGFYEQGLEGTLFLRAERRQDGERTFRIIPGEPLQTSFGEDLYHRIFATEQPLGEPTEGDSARETINVPPER